VGDMHLGGVLVIARHEDGRLLAGVRK
jgi:hypothetical protein